MPAIILPHPAVLADRLDVLERQNAMLRTAVKLLLACVESPAPVPRDAIVLVREALATVGAVEHAADALPADGTSMNASKPDRNAGDYSRDA